MTHSSAAESVQLHQQDQALLRVSTALMATVVAMMVFIGVLALITPRINSFYPNEPPDFFAPAHFNDARQYVMICIQGYDVPLGLVLPTLARSRLSWMPVYALAHCGLHRLSGISYVYTGVWISMFSIGIAVFFAFLTLSNLGVRGAPLLSLILLMPPIGAAWLYLPGAEAIYLAVGMVVMWLITVPNGRFELIRVVIAIPMGAVFVLTKPNALAFILPLVFAFFYNGWRRSRDAGYSFPLDVYIADVLIEHLPFRTNEKRPVIYDWTPLCVVAGIALGFGYWLAYTSYMTGVPNYFLQQQLEAWGRAWSSGNVEEMVYYFAQAFRGVDSSKPWRLNSAWNLAANVSALIPAASPRVPTLLRGMIPLMVMFLVFSGAVHGSDRYILSTALVALGWACWVAPSVNRPRYGWVFVRIAFLLLVSVLTSWMLLDYMLPTEPNSWAVVER